MTRPPDWPLLLLSTLLSTLPASAHSGTVLDPSGAPVPHAAVTILSPTGALLHQLQTDSSGRFEWSGPTRGAVQLRISGPGFTTSETVLHLLEPVHTISISLLPESVYSRITVTATRGAPDEALASPHIVIVKDLAASLQPPGPTIGDSLEREPGILVQRSTSAQVSPFLRGLTGYHVLNLIDGVRFNNSTFRSGPNQYLALIDPSQASRVEALLGPAGVQFGSDSLGGAIHVLTPQPRFSPTTDIHGALQLSAASADLSGAAATHLSLATERIFFLGGLSTRRHNDLRAGNGYDSHHVLRRLFGLSPQLVRSLSGSRLQDTSFSQHGLHSKLGLRLTPTQLLSLNYQHGLQLGVRGYKDLNGGLGRLQSSFSPQSLHWLYARYEKLALGPLDSLSATLSRNSQSDGATRQGLRSSDSITSDHALVVSHGLTLQAASHFSSRTLLTFGAESYDERIRSRRSLLDPLSSSSTSPRPLYPDNSRYRNSGLFAQGATELSHSLRASAGLRWTDVRFSSPAHPAYLSPASAQRFADLTFHATLQLQLSPLLALHAVASRGFRAPNLNDLGALGLNDLGYELPSSEALPAGALLSTDSGENATSKGRPLAPLSPESLSNYEFGARISSGRLYLRTQLFHASLSNPIVRRTLLFPANSPPLLLAGLPVSPIPQTPAQAAQSVVTVATSLDPRAVKAFTNDGRSLYYGLESLARYSLSRRLSLEANYHFIAGRDLLPNRPIRRLPPQAGAATLRYTLPGNRPWFEASLAAAGSQSRLSGGDLDDERIGASLRRADIAAFFSSARVASLLDPSATLFLPTRESLAQIQNRVLPLGAIINGVRVTSDSSRVPLFLSTPAWAALHLRAGFPLGERWQALASIENLLDRNYRLHGSGIDAPGFNASLSLRFLF